MRRADRIPRRLDARIDMDERKALPEAGVEKQRNRGQRLAVVSRHETGTDLELADIELAVARHAPVALSRTVAGGKHDLETICFDRLLFERAEDLLIADGHGDSNFGRHAARSGENGVLERRRRGLHRGSARIAGLRRRGLPLPDKP
jgi:hypothetical protein